MKWIFPLFFENESFSLSLDLESSVWKKRGFISFSSVYNLIRSKGKSSFWGRRSFLTSVKSNLIILGITLNGGNKITRNQEGTLPVFGISSHPDSQQTAEAEALLTNEAGWNLRDFNRKRHNFHFVSPKTRQLDSRSLYCILDFPILHLHVYSPLASFRIFLSLVGTERQAGGFVKLIQGGARF